MRRAISQQLSFGDGFIDPNLHQLDEELKKVDELLSQGPLLKPFAALFDESMGRPGTPEGIYLRMMYLKFRWGLSYEEVEIEVRERLSGRQRSDGIGEVHATVSHRLSAQSGLIRQYPWTAFLPRRVVLNHVAR